MFTALYRIIKYGLLGFWRNGWLSATTISIMLLTLIVFEGLFVSNIFAKTMLSVLKDKIDISVYFKIDTPEDNILKTQRALENLSEIKSVEYISKDKALENFKTKYSDTPAISQSLEELKDNPLSASLNIRAYNPEEYSVINTYLNNFSLKESFSNVTYNESLVMIERLNKVINIARNGGAILAIFLALMAILVTFNTIRLAIYSNRDEIGIMRLVGASNLFVRGPYIVEGILYGLIAGVLSFALILPIIYFISPYIKIFIPEINLWSYFMENFLNILGYQLFFGIFLGIISSIIAIRRYLKI